MTKLAIFDGVEIRIIDRDGQQWLTARDLARALQYSDASSVLRLYNRNADEFDADMTAVVTLSADDDQGQSDREDNEGTVNLTVPSHERRSDGGAQQTRIFSLRGAHLVAFFATTEVAKRFRRWVLDVIEGRAEAPQPARAARTVDPLPAYDGGAPRDNRLWLWRSKLWEALNQLRQLGDKAPYGLDTDRARLLPRPVAIEAVPGEEQLGRLLRAWLDARAKADNPGSVTAWHDRTRHAREAEAREALLAHPPATPMGFALRLVVLLWWPITCPPAPLGRDAHEKAMLRQAADVVMTAILTAEDAA